MDELQFLKRQEERALESQVRLIQEVTRLVIEYTVLTTSL